MKRAYDVIEGDLIRSPIGKMKVDSIREFTEDGVTWLKFHDKSSYFFTVPVGYYVTTYELCQYCDEYTPYPHRWDDFRHFD